jgi:arylsulfatase
MVRWPGLVKPRTEINEVFSAEDWMQTLLGAVGEPDLKNKLMKGATIANKTFKVHLDGYDQRDLLRNGSGGARKEFFYWTDDGGLAGLRYGNWKLAFMEQRAHGFDVWQEPMVTLRLPKLFNLRTDPFERADHEGMGYAKWRIDRAYALVPAQAYVGEYLKTLQEFPPRQRPGSFNLDAILQKLTASEAR